MIDDVIAQYSETGDLLRWYDFMNLSLTSDIAKKAKKLDKKILALSRYRLFVFSKGTFGSYSVLLSRFLFPLISPPFVFSRMRFAPLFSLPPCFIHFLSSLLVSSLLIH